MKAVAALQFLQMKPKFWGRLGWYLCLGGVLLFLIVLIKSKTATTYLTSPFLLFYTVFVTIFELSRLVGAMFFEKMDAEIQQPNLAWGEDVYEPFVSIVIPCKNEEKTITKTILKCFEADYPQEKLEVIIVNDGSTDGTAKILHDLKESFSALAVVQWRRNRGKRHAMAEGFKRARGEVVVQLDSDSYVEPRTFRNLIVPFRHDEIGAVCAHTEPENADENMLTKMQAAYYFMSFRILKAAESVFMTVFCCSGCSSAYRRSIVAPVLDEWCHETFLGKPITWGDDRALTNWVLRQGYKTIYTNKALARTIVPQTFLQFLKQQVRWKKGWFVNSLFAARFIYKDQPFVSYTYFFPLIVLTLATPFIAGKALVYNTVIHGAPPFYYMAGIFLIASIITTYYKYIAPNDKYWPYIFVWSGINLVFLSFILLYSLATIQNRKWGTR